MPSRVLLDSNLALLLVAGLTTPSSIAKHKRLQAYDIDDFEAIAGLVDQSGGLQFCPNVWSETSNLVRYTGEPLRSEISRTLARLVAAFGETYVESGTATQREEYVRLGLTDSVILCLAETGTTLVTVDLDLYLAAQSAGYENAINYNHLRERRYDLK